MCVVSGCGLTIRVIPGISSRCEIIHFVCKQINNCKQHFVNMFVNNKVAMTIYMYNILLKYL